MFGRKGDSCLCTCQESITSSHPLLRQASCSSLPPGCKAASKGVLDEAALALCSWYTHPLITYLLLCHHSTVACLLGMSGGWNQEALDQKVGLYFGFGQRTGVGALAINT